MIHRISIRNFRSLRDVTVELGPVTVLIGKSGTGKSNFVSAIRFLRDYLTQGPQGQAAVNRCATNSEAAFAFEIEFDVPGFEHRFVYTIDFDAQYMGSRPQRESLRYGEESIFVQTCAPHRAPEWETPPALVSPPQPGEPVLGRLPGLEAAVVAYTALTVGIGTYAFPFSVLTTSANGRNAPGLADDGSNFLSVMKDVASSLQNIAPRKGIAAALRQINPTVASVELDSIHAPKTAFVGHQFGEKTLALELRQESDGFRRFYAHLLALYQTPPKQTLVFEEPENGIYPGALSLLAEEFHAAPNDGRGQVLLTTHNPSLLDHFTADQIRVVELVNLETRIGRLAEEQKQALTEELLHAGELLTVDPARGSNAL